MRGWIKLAVMVGVFFVLAGLVKVGTYTYTLLAFQAKIDSNTMTREEQTQFVDQVIAGPKVNRSFFPSLAKGQEEAQVSALARERHHVDSTGK